MIPMEFHPERTLRAISRWGYHHLDLSVDRKDLEPFLEENGLVIESVNRCSITIVPSGCSSSGFDWDAYKKEQDEKKAKRAVAKKKKQLNDTTP